jgi:NADH-quinone oxidoreductase subunit N
MMIFMLSLAGIPPLAGFFGKFYLFTTLLDAGLPKLGSLWLVALAVGTSAVSLYYYLRVLKQIYVVETPAGAVVVPVPILSQIVVTLLALAVVILGCAPWLLMDRLVGAMM